MKKAIFIILILSLGISPSFAQQYGWVDLTANLPDTNVYGGLGKVTFIGEQGWITPKWYSLPRRIFYTSDGGKTFTTQYLPDDAGRISGIFIRNACEGYIITDWDSLGNSGKIFHTTDAPNGNWTLLSELSGTGLMSIGFPPYPDTIGYIGAGAGEVYKIIGNSVVYDGSCQTNYDLIGIVFPVSSNEGWAAGCMRIHHRDPTGWKIDQNFPPGCYTSI